MKKMELQPEMDLDAEAEFYAELEKVSGNIKSYLKRYNREAAKVANQKVCDTVNNIAKNLSPEEPIPDAGINSVVEKETLEDLELLSKLSAIMLMRSNMPKDMQQLYKRAMKEALRDAAIDSFTNGIMVGMGIGRMDLMAGLVHKALERSLANAEPSSKLQ